MSSQKIKIIMIKRVAWIWKENDVVEVSHSQAKNYLIPKWFARLASDQDIKNIEKKKNDQEKNLRDLRFNRHKIAEALHSKNIILEARWDGEKIFGWISEADIVDKINKEFGIKLEKKNVILPEWHHLKKAWTYDIKLNLWTDVYVKMSVELVSVR